MTAILSVPGGSVSVMNASDESAMDASDVLSRLSDLIDARRWEDLPGLLHEDFACRYVHTGEQFGRDDWVRLNADYPGFDHLVIEDLVGAGDRAVARCHVTGDAASPETPADGSGAPLVGSGAPGEERLLHFEVATFVRVREGRITEMTEVWTDVAQTPPEGTRPQ